MYLLKSDLIMFYSGAVFCLLDAMKRMVGSAIDVSWKRKNGGEVDTKVILVPISYQEHLFALHFISEK